MRVLLVGCGSQPSSFLRRLIQTLTYEGVQTENFDQLDRGPGWRRRLVTRGATWAAPRTSRRAFFDSDLVHFQWPGHYEVWRTLATRSGRPTVLSLRGRQGNILPWLPGNEEYRSRIGSHLQEVNLVHCVSDDMAEVAVSLGTDPAKVRVVRPAVDTSIFVPADHGESSTPRIAMVGALIWRKAYEHALLALREIMKRGHRFGLSIAGEGPDRSKLEFMLHELGLEGCVSLVGNLSETGIIALLQESDIFLHTSLSEGLANGVIEAMACGLPVVTTDVGGMKEAVESGRNGFVVPPRDHNAIADAVGELITQPSLRREAGLIGRELAVHHFNLKDQGPRFAALYGELAS